jgi:FkbM family methyltransferase
MAEMIRILFVAKRGAFIDVGVNLGQTILKVAAVDKSRPYLGFEPNPACADYASELATANKLDYRIIPAGFGVRTSILELNFFRSEDTDPSASLIPSFRPNVTRSKPVVVVGLSDIPSEWIPDPIAIVKIDVEGGEAEVIDGLVPLIRKGRPFILVEILPAYSSDNHNRIERQLRIERALRELSYLMCRVIRDGRNNLVGVRLITEIGIQTDLADADYLMVPEEDVENLERLISIRAGEVLSV